DKVTRTVRLGVSVATTGDAREQPKVADGASELLQQIFGKEKNPSRLVYGVASLPLGATVELEIIFEVDGARVRNLTSYRTIQIDGLSIFYREAGPKNAPTLLLLHGLPSSSPMVDPLFARRAFWADRAANENTLRTNLLSLATTRTRHVGSDPDAERYDPDLWTDEFAFLSQAGQADIQSDLFYDYRTNVDAYPKWQAWMRE